MHDFCYMSLFMPSLPCHSISLDEDLEKSYIPFPSILRSSTIKGQDSFELSLKRWDSSPTQPPSSSRPKRAGKKPLVSD